MRKEVGWELYRSFLGVLSEGSLSGAARLLGITQPTVGRHISALETSLGFALFTRSQAGLLPTEAALSLRTYAEAMSSTAAALQRAAASQGAGVKGTVRVSASEVVGAELLPPILGEIRDQHPELTIELVLTNRVQDLLRREADIAVRMTPPRQGALVAKRVDPVTLGLHAHRSYLALRGTPRNSAELERHSLIGFDVETPFLRAARKALPMWTREAFSLRTDSDLAQLALIRSGCGIGVCQVAIAKRDPSLVRVMARQFEFKLETWVTMHEDLRSSPRCKVTFDALVRGLTDGG
ncbi:MAG TPA: LysR family transcriptional regulator [Steroidobacteraceae bacterium]|jgi:DNA-binding transcriptional LysR family regulator|nr:LysR family transcriptional regulator [Steroidobacteraceae bacterium]